MRGEDRTTDQLFSYVNVEDRIASDYPLQQIRLLVNDALKALDADFCRTLRARYQSPVDRARAPVAGDAAEVFAQSSQA